MITNEVVIALGSNIEPEENLELAVVALKSKFKVSKRSRWIQTKPIGILDQPDFFNGVLIMVTELGIESLKQELKSIEDLMGRDRSKPKFGPRIIDLDILIWNGKIIDKDYYDRDFLRKGVVEILPDFDSKS